MLKTSASTRAEDTEPFRAMDLLARARELERTGRDIVHLAVGEPDFATADAITQAGKAALDAGRTAYTDAPGIPELRIAIATDYGTRHGLTVDPQRVLVTPGASGALLLALAYLVNEGDEVLLPDPSYPCNRNFVRAMRGVPRLVKTSAESRFQLTADKLRAAWSGLTQGVLMASPSNPTGTLVPQSELAAIVRSVADAGGFCVMDEIYHGLTYGADHPAQSALAIDDDVFVVNSFSKYFGMTGWRLGWLVAPENAVAALTRIAQNLYIAAPTVAQYAALAAFEPETIAVLESRRIEFEKRLAAFVPALQQAGLHVPVAPGGAFYVYANLADHPLDAPAFCAQLLENYGVATTPGRDFGEHDSHRWLRLTATLPTPQLLEGANRIGEALRATR